MKKLFCWNRPYHIDYGGSCVFALGKSIEEARINAKTALVWEYGIGRPDKKIPIGLDLDRDPDLILEDGAVCYEWSE